MVAVISDDQPRPSVGVHPDASQGSTDVTPSGAVSEQLTLVMAASITAMDTGATATTARAGSDAKIAPHATRATHDLLVMYSDIESPSTGEREVSAR
jgi:hypothetical protein